MSPVHRISTASEILLASLLSLLILPVSVRQTSPAAAIYSKVLQGVSDLPATQFRIVRDTVPYPRTKSQFPVDPEHVVMESAWKARLAKASKSEFTHVWRDRPCIVIPDRERERYVSAMQDYLRQNATSNQLDVLLELAHPYHFLSEEQALKANGGPGNDGFFQVSAVGFSSDGQLAIVYVGFDCMLCGRWNLRVLRKQDSGGWQEVQASSCGFVS